MEYIDDVIGRPGGEQVVSYAYASRLVVISAGAFGSPAILERLGQLTFRYLILNGSQVGNRSPRYSAES